jgi:hypothetical protein
MNTIALVVGDCGDYGYDTYVFATEELAVQFAISKIKAIFKIKGAEMFGLPIASDNNMQQNYSVLSRYNQWAADNDYPQYFVEVKEVKYSI